MTRAVSAVLACPCSDSIRPAEEVLPSGRILRGFLSRKRQQRVTSFLLWLRLAEAQETRIHVPMVFHGFVSIDTPSDLQICSSFFLASGAMLVASIRNRELPSSSLKIE